MRYAGNNVSAPVGARPTLRSRKGPITGMDAHQQTAADPVGEAIARGDWPGALTQLRSTEAVRQLSAHELQQLAQAAYGQGELEASISAWERLHARSMDVGDHVAAATAATTVAMYLMMDTGLMAPVRGWVRRAERLLEDEGELGVHAWLALVRTYERLMSGDMDGARHWADTTIDVGLRHRQPAPVAIGRVAAARLLIFDGRADEGLHLLDEAAVATVSGELDPLSVGMLYCELICAMQGLAQYDRAEEWTEAMERWRGVGAFGGINGRCRVHRAEILRLRGSCAEAEEEALHACAELRPWMRREFGWPLTELGTIRLRKGDLAGAEEAFLAAHENGWEPQPGLALLRLAQGEVATASVLIRDALEHPVNVPSKERPPYGGLCRAPLLDAQTEIALARDDLATARQSAGELAEIAAVFRSRALTAAAALARGRVALADGDAGGAVGACEEAVAGWSDVGAPYEVSVARVVLAQAHRALGNEDCALLELHAAHAGFERVGARRHAEQVAGALTGGAAPSVPPAPTGAPSENVFRLDGDTRTVVFDGDSVLLHDLKGMRYLERLLAEPGREFHVLDLVAAERGAPLVPSPTVTEHQRRHSDGAGPVLDAQAKQAYRRRLDEIDEDIEEAKVMGDSHRVALAEADREYLVHELASAYGLGGRERQVGSDSERARASVTRALRYAVERIAEHHPKLATHIEQTVCTGTYCSYVPDCRIPTSWVI